MKKASLFTRLMTIFFFSLLVFSCKKETSDSGLTPQQEEEVSSVSIQSEAESELVFNDVFDNVLGVNTEVGIGGTGVFGRTALAGRENGIDSVPACVTISTVRLSTSEPFPVKLTVDFGAGCPGKDGRMRYGKIIVTYTGRLTVPGKSATAIFDGFRLDSFSVQGSYTITNTTSTVQRQFTIDIKDAKITKPGGDYSQWTAHRVITQVEGNGTPDLPLDDIFTITGSAHGKLSRSNSLFAWHSEIIEPLWKKFTCRWISKGSLKLWRESLSSNSKWAATLNYGDGTCDFLAKLTINDVPRDIKLPH